MKKVIKAKETKPNTWQGKVGWILERDEIIAITLAAITVGYVLARSLIG